MAMNKITGSARTIYVTYYMDRCASIEYKNNNNNKNNSNYNKNDGDSFEFNGPNLTNCNGCSEKFSFIIIKKKRELPRRIK